MNLNKMIALFEEMANKHNKPHKFLLLLAVIDLLEAQTTPSNRFSYYDLKELFSQNIYEHNLNISNKVYYPFFHLKNDGFWKLIPKYGREHILTNMSTVVSAGDVTRNVEYACFTDEAFTIIKHLDNRAIVRSKLLSILKKYCETESFIKEGPKKYSLQSSLFEHEQNAINRIVKSIRRETRVLSNIYIFDKQTNNYLEYDLIVIANAGIYVVELKHWSGNIEIRPYQWRIDKTKYRVDPHKTNSFKSKVLKGLYNHNFVTYPNIWVESVVVLTNPEANIENADTPEFVSQKHKHNYTFASISDFVSFIKRKEQMAPALEDRQIGMIAKYIAQLNNPNTKQREYSVKGYETVEYLSQKPECIELLARPLGIKAIGLHRLRVFRPIQDTSTERERLKKIAFNTLNAVGVIGDSPNINKVWAMQSEDGDIIEISDWSEIGTLQDLLYDNKGGLPLKQALPLCKGIALGLRQAHEKNIIHRAIKPENILIKNDIPKLMNFDLSFQLEDNRLTVIPDASKVRDDGYLAPELLFNGDIDEATDYFSLGVIAYQLLTGEKPFKTTRDFISWGGKLSAEHRRKLDKARVPEQTISVIEKMIVANREERFMNINQILLVFSFDDDHKSTMQEGLLSNSKLPIGDKHDMYEIVDLVGEGQETQIYKAKARFSQGEPATVILKVFNHETPPERIFRELEIGNKVRSPYIVRYQRPGHWQRKRYFIEEDYVHGMTLRQIIESGERPGRNVFDSVARSLMEGIRALHGNVEENGEQIPIIHGDIKPENIIITPKWKPVIIDLGAAGPPRVDVYQGTANYIPPDSILGSDRDFSLRNDLFALGVTLWEWLFGTAPYNNPSLNDKPVIPEELPDFQDLYSWLMKAVSTQPSEGFTSIIQMWNRFTKFDENEIEKGEDVTIDEHPAAIQEILQLSSDDSFVSYLNSFSCASAGNENAIAESQINNTHFLNIYVPNPLTEVICKLLRDNNNVILTGNAGDGKTTIAIDVLKQFIGGTLGDITARFEVPGHNLVVIKDMSELTKQDRISTLQEARTNKTKKYLIVSNTGTLLDAFTAIKGEIESEYGDLLSALKANQPSEILDKRFWLINIGQIDSIQTACKVFERMIRQENWIGCSQCNQNESCPVYRNVQLIRSNLDLIKHRIYLLYKRLYEYGQRLTMRQMTGHLAYAITGGLDCRSIANLSIMTRDQWSRGFFNLFFGDDGHNLIPLANKLIPVRVIHQAGFGITLFPKFERMAWLKNEATRVFNNEAGKAFKDLLEKHSPRALDSPILRRQVRRLAYFCGQFDGGDDKLFVSTFLESPMLADYLKDTSGIEVPSQAHLHKLLIKVLHILQEYFTGLRLPEDSWKDTRDIFITLRLPSNVAATQMILARFRDDDFELVIEPRYRYGGSKGSNNVFTLRYKLDSKVHLSLDLPFFDYVARRYDGDLTYQLSAYYSNRLEDFKGKLLRSSAKSWYSNEALHLLRIRPDCRFEELTLLINKDELEVI